jgi:hypothetical protein
MDYEKMIFKYTESEISEKYDKFIQMIKDEFVGERQEKLIQLYSTEPWKSQLKYAPASSIAYFHNAYVSGYIDHIFNVIENSKAMYSFYKNKGGIIDFELEELIFAAMHHDLGKLGDENGPHYQLNDSEWHITNQQMFFKTNGDIQRMDPGTRGFYVLSQFQISMTWKELLGIRLADGLYEESNKEFLKPGPAEKLQLKTNLPKILHVADFMAANLERDEYYSTIKEQEEEYKKTAKKLFNK